MGGEHLLFEYDVLGWEEAVGSVILSKRGFEGYPGLVMQCYQRESPTRRSTVCRLSLNRCLLSILPAK